VKSGRVGWLVVVASCTCATTAASQTTDRAACEAAHVQAQEDKSASRLIASRQQLYKCAAKTCPGLILQDCTEWLSEVQRNIPSMIPAAKTADGRELVAVKVSTGGRVLTERLDGKPIDLDPGSYTLRFELEGAAPMDVDFVAQAGVKNRIVEATFPGDVSQAKPENDSSPPVAFWVLAGVGTVALISFGTFAILGQKEYSDLESECAPRCNPGDSDSVSTKFLIADISLGVAIAAYAGAAYVYFARPGADAPAALSSGSRGRATRLGVAPLAHGGLATFEASF
jgi:hypothetical protein